MEQSQILMEGPLMKRGAHLPVMSQRYCVLKGKEMLSFKSKHDFAKGKPLSHHELSSVAEWDGNKGKYPHGFTIHSAKSRKTFHCSAATQEEKQAWMAALTIALRVNEFGNKEELVANANVHDGREDEEEDDEPPNSEEDYLPHEIEDNEGSQKVADSAGPLTTIDAGKVELSEPARAIEENISVRPVPSNPSPAAETDSENGNSHRNRSLSARLENGDGGVLHVERQRSHQTPLEEQKDARKGELERLSEEEERLVHELERRRTTAEKRERTRRSVSPEPRGRESTSDDSDFADRRERWRRRSDSRRERLERSRDRDNSYRRYSRRRDSDSSDYDKRPYRRSGELSISRGRISRRASPSPGWETDESRGRSTSPTERRRERGKKHFTQEKEGNRPKNSTGEDDEDDPRLTGQNYSRKDEEKKKEILAPKNESRIAAVSEGRGRKALLLQDDEAEEKEFAMPPQSNSGPIRGGESNSRQASEPDRECEELTSRSNRSGRPSRKNTEDAKGDRGETKPINEETGALVGPIETKASTGDVVEKPVQEGSNLAVEQQLPMPYPSPQPVMMHPWPPPMVYYCYPPGFSPEMSKAGSTNGQSQPLQYAQWPYMMPASVAGSHDRPMMMMSSFGGAGPPQTTAKEPSTPYYHPMTNTAQQTSVEHGREGSARHGGSNESTLLGTKDPFENDRLSLRDEIDEKTPISPAVSELEMKNEHTDHFQDSLSLSKEVGIGRTKPRGKRSEPRRHARKAPLSLAEMSTEELERMLAGGNSRKKDKIRGTRNEGILYTEDDFLSRPVRHLALSDNDFSGDGDIVSKPGPKKEPKRKKKKGRKKSDDEMLAEVFAGEMKRKGHKSRLPGDENGIGEESRRIKGSGRTKKSTKPPPLPNEPAAKGDSRGLPPPLPPPLPTSLLPPRSTYIAPTNPRIDQPSYMQNPQPHRTKATGQPPLPPPGQSW